MEQFHDEEEIDTELNQLHCTTTVNRLLFLLRDINRRETTRTRSEGIFHLKSNIDKNLKVNDAVITKIRSSLNSDDPCAELAEYCRSLQRCCDD